LGALQLGVGYTTTVSFYWQNFAKKVKFKNEKFENEVVLEVFKCHKSSQ
jgi:hypothetical protein